MVKWTLNPRIGQRQWTDFEANGVLEDLRTVDGDDYDDYDDEEEEGEGEGENEDEGGQGAIAAGAAVAAELGLDLDETNNEEGEVFPFADDETTENPNEEDQQEGNEDEGSRRVIAAGAAVAGELGLDVDETDNEAGQVPPFPHDETMQILNQDAEDTEVGNQAKDKEEQEEGERGGNEEEEGVVVGGAAAAAVLGLDIDEAASEAGEPPFPHNETTENQNQNAKETETGDQTKDEDDAVDGGEGDPVAPQRSYTCGRCSEGIDPDSTFYRCVGHSCCGAFKPQSSIF